MYALTLPFYFYEAICPQHVVMRGPLGVSNAGLTLFHVILLTSNEILDKVLVPVGSRVSLNQTAQLDTFFLRKVEPEVFCR